MEGLEKTLKELNNENLYKILRIERTNDIEKIKKAYKKLIITHHPDKNKQVDTVEIFEKIRKAYEILKNLDTKGLYDSYLNRKEEKSNRLQSFSDKRKKFVEDLKRKEQNNNKNSNTNTNASKTDNTFKTYKSNLFEKEQVTVTDEPKVNTLEQKLCQRGIKIKWSKESQLLFTKETIISYFKVFGPIEDVILEEGENRALIVYISNETVVNVINKFGDDKFLSKMFKIKKCDLKNLQDEDIIKNIKNSYNNTKNVTKEPEISLEDFEKAAFEKFKLKFK